MHFCLVTVTWRSDLKQALYCGVQRLLEGGAYSGPSAIGVVLIKVWCLFETRHLLQEIS